MADFRTEYVANQDLIYGIGEHIDRYVIYHMEGVKCETLTFKQTERAREGKSSGYYAINTFNVHLTNASYKEVASPKQVAYIDAFRASPMRTYYSENMSVDKVTGPKLEKYKKSNKFLDRRDPHAVRAAAHDFAIRRSCKFGIQYVTQTLGGTIHYVLDGMTMGAIAARNVALRWRTNNSGYTKIPICTTELRYLFRNWNRYKGKVRFWENFEEALPPWGRAEHVDDWCAYAIGRIVKYWNQIKANQDTAKYRLTQLLGNSATKISTAEEVHQYLERSRSRNPADVIAKFHRIPVDLINKEAEEES